MLNTRKYDFSEEATFKDKLLSKCKERYNKALALSAPMSDDELELVTAAGVSLDGGLCPNRDLPCEKCDKYLNSQHLANHCADGFRK
jgi:hypothetical protein